MSAITNEQLIDLIDNNLSAADRAALESVIATDSAVRDRYEDLQFSVALVREEAVREQVAQVCRDLSSGKLVTMKPRQAVVRPLFGNVLKIAVLFLVVFGAALTYKLVSTTGAGLAGDHFVAYDLNTARGAAADESALETAYRNKDWKTVQSLAGKMTDKTAKAWFLAGMADMELHDYNAAVANFISLQEQNQRIKEPAFQEEAEYYLALAYLGAGKSAKGIELLEKIRADKSHLFHEKAMAVSSTSLKVLEIKGDK